MELLKFPNGLKRPVEKKQTELGAILEKQKCLEGKRNTSDGFFSVLLFFVRTSLIVFVGIRKF